MTQHYYYYYYYYGLQKVSGVVIVFFSCLSGAHSLVQCSALIKNTLMDSAVIVSVVLCCFCCCCCRCCSAQTLSHSREQPSCQSNLFVFELLPNSPESFDKMCRPMSDFWFFCCFFLIRAKQGRSNWINCARDAGLWPCLISSITAAAAAAAAMQICADCNRRCSLNSLGEYDSSIAASFA